MSRGDLPRERCKERAVERGQRSLYHHPEAEERTRGGGGAWRRSGCGRKISSTKGLYSLRL